MELIWSLNSFNNTISNFNYFWFGYFLLIFDSSLTIAHAVQMTTTLLYKSSNIPFIISNKWLLGVGYYKKPEWIRLDWTNWFELDLVHDSKRE